MADPNAQNGNPRDIQEVQRKEWGTAAQCSPLPIRMQKDPSNTPNRSFSCPVCTLTCKSLRTLRTHVRLRHRKYLHKAVEVEGAKSHSENYTVLESLFPCPICGKCVAAETAEAHLESHTAQVCAAYADLEDINAKIAIAKALLALIAEEGAS